MMHRFGFGCALGAALALLAIMCGHAHAQSTPEQILGLSAPQNCPLSPSTAGWGTNCIPTLSIWDRLFSAKADGPASPVFLSNLPVIGGTPGGLAQGTRSGNTTEFGTVTGSLTNGHCVSIDASGNLIDAGGACTTGGGGGTVNSGVLGQLGYYASTGSAVSGAGNDTISTGGTLTVNAGAYQGYLATQAATGSISSGVSTPFSTNDYGMNFIDVASDNVTRPTSGNANKFAAQLILHEYGGSALVGGRISLDVLSILTAPSSASNNDHEYQASDFAEYADVNDGGSNGSPVGALFGFGAVTILDHSGTYWNNITGGEINVAATSGSSVYYKSGLQIADLPQDAVQGSGYDAEIALSNQNGAVGWLNGILFGPMNGAQPVSSSGCLICTTGSTAVGKGIDFSSYNFVGNAIHTPGFSVSSGGEVSVGITPTTNWGMDFSAAASSISSGGNAILQAGAGLIVVHDQTINQGALYLCAGDACALIGTPGTTWVNPTTSPAAGKLSVAFNGSRYAIYNNQGSPQTVAAALIATQDAP